MKQGDIVVIPFPFTDLSGQKIRPAYVLSNEKYNTSRNVIVAAISSKPGISELAISLENSDLEEGVLRKKSFIRLQNIFTLEKRLIQQKVGEVSAEKRVLVKEMLLESFE